jgi:hypothetical protein
MLQQVAVTELTDKINTAVELVDLALAVTSISTLAVAIVTMLEIRQQLLKDFLAVARLVATLTVASLVTIMKAILRWAVVVPVRTSIPIEVPTADLGLSL